MRVLNKYLERYAEPEATLPTLFTNKLRKSFKHCAVMPCFDEDITSIERIAKHPVAKETLLILVINQPENRDDGEKTRNRNKSLYDRVTASGIIERYNNLCLCRVGPLNILVVDRFNPKRRIPNRQGVGLARKVGFDIACRLWQRKCLLSAVINSIDADVTLPGNYFDTPAETASAFVFNFSHSQSDSRLSKATQQYEKSIKYYRCGLEWANSPYAFFTLGSCLAVNVNTYAQVRGFPKRAAGEDFYLLNKISKIGKVIFCPQIRLEIEARLSNRVPFGTGPAVQKILDKPTVFNTYNPVIFCHLRQLLSWASSSMPKTINNSKFCGNQVLEQSLESRDISKESAHALRILNVSRFFQHVKSQHLSEDQIVEQFHTWFDGFRTLKLVHCLQDDFFPALPLESCLTDFLALKEKTSINIS